MKQVIILSGKEARERSETQAKGLTHGEMKTIMHKITKAIEWGKTEIMIDGYIN